MPFLCLTHSKKPRHLKVQIWCPKLHELSCQATAKFVRMCTSDKTTAGPPQVPSNPPQPSRPKKKSKLSRTDHTYPAMYLFQAQPKRRFSIVPFPVGCSDDCTDTLGLQTLGQGMLATPTKATIDVSHRMCKRLTERGLLAAWKETWSYQSTKVLVDAGGINSLLT